MYTGVKLDEKLQSRLDQILDKITTKDFVSGKGLGNEIAFYIFDYSPEHEITVRKHIKFMLERIKSHTDLKVVSMDLFVLIVEHLKERGLLDRSIKLEQKKGRVGLQKALKAPLKPENLVRLFKDKAKPSEHDLVFVTGVGNAWPSVRSHSLLNNLQPVMGNTPLILFYPGRFDGQTVQLFGKLKSNPYYRAFRLIQ
jgi:hypothetical protein